jgi:bifunctional non-homologous end joining protein LigD
MLWRTPSAKRQPLGYIEPCIPTRAEKPAVGPQWVHEIKHDAYRQMARKRNGRVRLFTRRGYDWTDRYPLIRKVLAAVRAASATIDGDGSGRAAVR